MINKKSQFNLRIFWDHFVFVILELLWNTKITLKTYQICIKMLFLPKGLQGWPYILVSIETDSLLKASTNYVFSLTWVSHRVAMSILIFIWLLPPDLSHPPKKKDFTFFATLAIRSLIRSHHATIFQNCTIAQKHTPTDKHCNLLTKPA